jgi:arsenite/tail-anchored protein-transporting ATPase
MEMKPYLFTADQRHLFFTGKGGVGKTSIACASAIALADSGKRVLIVSTDPASNLDDVFEMKLTEDPQPIPGMDRLSAANLDPEEVAAAYKEKVLGPYKGLLPESAIASIEEQLSGACTVEIAAFDEFTKLLTDAEIASSFDHILFDTAPTGHTLRLLQLPMAWTNFLSGNTHGASCLGPLSGLGDKKETYEKAVRVLSDPNKTQLILVSRPDKGALQEAERASKELRELGISNQQLVINGVFERHSEDAFAKAYQSRQEKTLKEMPSGLQSVSTSQLPLVPYSLTGVKALRKLGRKEVNLENEKETVEFPHLESIQTVIERLSELKRGLILTMGKGGVGKTTIASLIAIGLAEKGHRVHLSTTDPAAHLSMTLGSENLPDQLQVDRIDPIKETELYREEVIRQVSPTLDEEGIKLLEEDLSSPCTEEIAVFRAFARITDEAEDRFVVLDTAPTGHTLLLLDAAQSYHKEVARTTGEVPESVRRLLPRLRNPEETKVFIVTLAEATPVLEASRLQQDLKRAGIQPAEWIFNQVWGATETKDPVLHAKAKSEAEWIYKVLKEYTENGALIPWQIQEPLGYERLRSLLKRYD